MRRRDLLPELLAPAGDFEALVAAVAAGADAVYVGGKAFSARAYAKNFDLDELSLATDYAHTHGVKLYVTVNTLVYDKELSELSNYAASLYAIGVDAIICADLGAVSEIRRRVPNLPIHASTQMSVHNSYGADLAAELGCERVVLARELSFENIKSVTEKSKPEIEVFVHGALCVSHSGQCLMSSLVGGRSGNRGECAQPCRLSYNGTYPLSLSDLSLSQHINELIDSGVASLKIEGRMKSAEYVYRVTSIYRRLLDEHRCANEKEDGELRAVFSRGGFTDGYFVGRTEGAMTGVRSLEDKESTERLGKLSFEPQRKRIRAKAKFALGEPSSLTLFLGERSYTATGGVPTAAISSPLSKGPLKERLSKMGATFFSLSEEDIELSVEDGINLSVSEINELRRAAVRGLLMPKRAEISTVENCSLTYENEPEKKLVTAQFFNTDAYVELKKAVSSKNLPDVSFLPISYEGIFEAGEGVSIPPVVMENELPYVKARLSELILRGAKCALVSNIGAIAIARELGLLPYGDFRLNVTNSKTKDEYMRLGVCHLLSSPELTLPMARDIGAGVIVMGRIPLMLTERCFIKENFGCDRCGKAELTDRTGAKFPMIREFSHRNIILNSTLTYMGDKKAELSKYKIEHTHYLFTVESGAQIRKLLSDYEQGQPLLGVRRIGRREEQKPKEKSSKEQRATERKPSAAKPKQMPQKKNGTAPYGKRKPKKP